MRRAFVTGLTSAYGRVLGQRLRGRGVEVSALVPPQEDVPELREDGTIIVIGDVRDRSAVEQAATGSDVVFHLAALYQGHKAAESDFFAVNVDGTRNVLEAAKRNRVGGFVHVSTVGVHGHVARPPANERSELRPRDPYQQSKLAGERLALSYFRDGLPGAVLRPAAIYGPGDLRFLKLFRSVARGWFVMIGTGANLYHMVYLDDLVDATMLCAESSAARGQVFIVAGDTATTTAELVAKVASALGMRPPRKRLPLWPLQIAAPICQRLCRLIDIEPPLYPRRLEFFTDDRAFDITQARWILGFAPRVSLDEGIRRTMQWYEERGLLPRGRVRPGSTYAAGSGRG